MPDQTTDRLTEILNRAGTTDHISGSVAWHYCEDVRWLVDQLHAAREGLAALASLHLRAEADLAAAQQVIQAARGVDWDEIEGAAGWAESHSGPGPYLVWPPFEKFREDLAAYDSRKAGE